MMDAGQRNEPIYLEKPTRAGSSGEVTHSWGDADGNSPAEPTWAKIISQRGSEAFEAARTNATEIIRVMILYRADLKTTWRIKWNDQYYEITHVDRSKQAQNELWFTAQLKGAE